MKLKIYSVLGCIIAFYSIPAISEDSLSQEDVEKAREQNKTLLSESRICHNRASPNYNSLKYVIDEFNSLIDCLINDERNTLPRNMANYDEVYTAMQQHIDALAMQEREAIKEGDASAAANAAAKKVQAESNLEQRREQESQLEEFLGLRFGAALAFTYVDTPYVSNVSIKNSTISVEKSQSNKAVFMLETHKFFRYKSSDTVGIGPYAAVGLADTEGTKPLSNYSAGILIGFKEKDGNGSWNAGVGVYVDTRYQVLKNGISDGDSTAETDPSNLVVERDKFGIALMISSTW